MKYGDKKLIVFDLDGTLTESKSKITPDMARTLAVLLAQKKVAIIGGGTYGQFKKQFVAGLTIPKSLFSNLFLFPTTATAFYRYQKGWKPVYIRKLSKSSWLTIKKAFADVLQEIDYVPPKKTYGKVIENRGSQVTFSALGQDVVAALGKKGLALKEKWRDENTPIKNKIAKLVQKRLPQFEVHTSAFTSIDVTQKGIDKAYGIRQIEKVLHTPIKQMLFIGDGLYPGGNDYAARKSGIICLPVTGPKDTQAIIEKIIAE
jgi:phosphomannomutase